MGLEPQHQAEGIVVALIHSPACAVMVGLFMCFGAVFLAGHTSGLAG